MKKIVVSLMLALCLLLSAVALADDLPAGVQAIKDRGVLRVGSKVDVIGFGLQDTLTGEYSGLEVDIARKLAEVLGVDVEFTPVTAATRGQLIDSGDLDMVLATFTITEERKEQWDFSSAYYTDYVSLLVEKTSGIGTLADLVGKTVGVSSGSTTARALTEAMIAEGLISAPDYDRSLFDAATWTNGVSFRQYPDYPSISTALSGGEVDAFAMDMSTLAFYMSDSRAYVDAKFAPQDYGVCTKKGSDLSAWVEGYVSTWLADGTIDALQVANNLK